MDISTFLMLGIVFPFGQDRYVLGLGVDPHRSEFIDFERFAVEADPFLGIDHGTAVAQLDGQGTDGGQRRKKHQQQTRHKRVEQMLDHMSGGRHAVRLKLRRIIGIGGLILILVIGFVQHMVFRNENAVDSTQPPLQLVEILDILTITDHPVGHHAASHVPVACDQGNDRIVAVALQLRRHLNGGAARTHDQRRLARGRILHPDRFASQLPGRITTQDQHERGQEEIRHHGAQPQ